MLALCLEEKPVSTVSTFKSRDRTSERPGFHLRDDVLGSLDATRGDIGSPVYLCLDGTATQPEKLNNGGATVTVALQGEIARESGLLSIEHGRCSTRGI